KTGTGKMILNATNSTYVGQTTINAGILSASADGALGTAGTAVVFNGGVFNASGSFTANSTREFKLLGPIANTIDIDPGVTMTVDGIVSQTGSLTKTGSGTLKLTNSGNSYGNATTGGTYNSAGTIESNAPGNINTFALFQQGGNFHVTASGNY